MGNAPVPGQVRAFEHRVIAEQIGVNVGAWQRENVSLVGFDLAQRVLQQALLRVVKVRNQLRTFGEHPVQPAISLALQHFLALSGQVQMAEQVANLGAMLCVGFLDMFAGQAWLQQRRFALQFAQGHAVGGAQRIGHRQVSVMEHVEQFDEKRHFCDWAALNQGQDEFALFQADKEVGVFATGGNPLEIKQAAEPVRGEKGFQLGPSQRGEHRHG